MRRRAFLAGTSALTVGGLAGCLDALEFRSAGGEPPVLEDRPDAVYYPTHVEGMEMIGTAAAGEYSVGLFYSFPHRFWTVTGRNPERVEVRDEDDVHLMATLWDEESGTVLPVGAGLSMAVTRDGETVADKPPWPMLSQNMGFHYGDNFALEGNGTYDVEVSVGAMDARRFGPLEGRFEETASATISFEFSSDERDDIMFRRLDQAGEPGAVDLMEMEMAPVSTVPAADDLPGSVVGRGTSDDAEVVATAVEGDRYAGDGAYLAVSPRTPYNAVPLPMMSVSGALRRDGEAVFEGDLSAGIGPELGYHYGAVVDGIRSGDALTVTVDAPPQASRHEGYETAFLEMDAVELTVP